MQRTIAGIQLSQFEFDKEAGQCRAHYDQTEYTPSSAVIGILAEAMETDPTEFSPLYNSVDPDALDAIFRVGDPHNGDIEISFTHEGHTITVHSCGVIVVALPGHEVMTLPDGAGNLD
jgi:hypothetical protein